MKSAWNVDKKPRVYLDQFVTASRAKKKVLTQQLLENGQLDPETERVVRIFNGTILQIEKLKEPK